MKAIQIEVFGNPAEVVKAVDIPDVGAPVAALKVDLIPEDKVWRYRHERNKSPSNRPCCPTAR